MATINEEFVAEYARVVGNAHVAINGGIGDEDTPGTSLFYLSQLQSLADNQLPKFGVLQTSPASFLVTQDANDARFVTISAGQVAYNGETLSLPPQRLSIVRSFAQVYDTTNVYGMRIGFSIKEAKKAVGKVYSSVTTQSCSPGDMYVYIKDLALVQSLGFPVTAYLGGTTYVVFSGTNDAGTALKVDPGFNGGAGLPGGVSFGVGSRINFIYEPRFSALYGLPVTTVSNDPVAFGYYPWQLNDWLSIADLLIVNPQNPTIATFSSNPAITRTVVEYPVPTVNAPVFSPDDSSLISRVIDVTRSQLRQNRDRASVGDCVRALEEYTRAVSDTPGLSFREFWGTRPYQPTTYFGRGISFEGLERFEFSDAFGRAYFALTNSDVQRTFAIFRGDLYAHPSTLAGSPSATLQLNSHASLGLISTFNRGTYVYGVSAVTNAGETPPVYGSTIADNTLSSVFANEIQFSAVSGAHFYHIYRRSSIGGDQTEFRLTAPNEITGSGIFTAPSVVGNTDEPLTSNYTAFKVVASGSSQLGGILMRLRATNATLTNTTATVNVALYADSSGSVGAAISGAVGTAIPFSSLVISPSGKPTTDYQEFISKLDRLVTLSGTYWVVITLSAQPSAGQIMLQRGTTGSGTFATSSNGTSWSSANSKDVYYRLLGYIDNGRAGVNQTRRGVYLTSQVTLEPRRLRVYVPNIINADRGRLPLFGEDGDPRVASSETSETKNDMIVTVTAQLGSAMPVSFSVTVPQGTARDTAFPLGTALQKFDRVTSVQVVPGTNLRRGANNAVLWSIYDFITVETTP